VIARRVFVILTSAATAVSGCHRAVQTTPSPLVPETLSGIVSVTGTSFEQQIVLRSNGDVTVLSASATDSAALSRMGGIEVMVFGRSGKPFRVDHFTALSVAGARVVDGVLRDDGGHLVIETANGPMPLGNPPAALRKLVAGRVWIGGPLDTGPNTYGVIVPPRR
jgi:hypothetical protein